MNSYKFILKNLYNNNLIELIGQENYFDFHNKFDANFEDFYNNEFNYQVGGQTPKNLESLIKKAQDNIENDKSKIKVNTENFENEKSKIVDSENNLLNELKKKKMKSIN